MCSQLYENVFTISLKFHEENISEASASATKLIVFIKFYIKNVIFSNHTYVKTMSEIQNAPKNAQNYFIF